jgi:hypothetical protein
MKKRVALLHRIGGPVPAKVEATVGYLRPTLCPVRSVHFERTSASNECIGAKRYLVYLPWHALLSGPEEEAWSASTSGVTA